MNGLYGERWISPADKKKNDVKLRVKNKARRKKQYTESYEWVKKYKESHPCTDCKGFFQACQMQFDHLPGYEKKQNISQMVARRALNVVQEEIAKCELVCANCHALRTFNRQSDGVLDF